MFERFAKDARAVVQAAQEQAGALGAAQVGREHLLLGLAAGRGVAADALASRGITADDLRTDLARTGGLDADALATIGIDLDEVRRRVEASFGPGALSRRNCGRPPFSPGAKKALELSLREALALGEHHIGAEHVLLGVLRDPGEAVGAVLRARGVEPQGVRAAVLAARTRAA